ncbi:MAG: lysophospholipase [Fimbriimonadales bacterium]|nr:lysophospholipase [Fimbriimonadales bacterium]
MSRWLGILWVCVLVLGTSCARREESRGVSPENEVTFSSEDGKTVYADYYPVKEGAKGLVVLFHQAGSNAGEYEPIARRLNQEGYSALAVDLRSGGERWGRRNRTADGVGGSPSYEEAYPDMRSAVYFA